MPLLPATGLYVGYETFLRTVGADSLTNIPADVLMAYIDGASRDFERDCVRRFFPIRATNRYRFPPYQLAATWSLWVDDDLLSVERLIVAAGGQNALPIELTHLLLEPQQYGPPFSRVELDLSSQDVFQSGSTPQQSVAVTGLWGYAADRRAAGTISGLSFDPGETAATCSSVTLIDRGNVLVFGDDDTGVAEMVFVADRNPNDPTQITVVRGVNGTDAVLHADDAPVARFLAPTGVERVIIGDALTGVQRDQSFWQTEANLRAQTGDSNIVIDFRGGAQRARRAEAVMRYGRPRSAAI